MIGNRQSVRRANDRLQALAAEVVPAEQLVPFLYECADGTCLRRVDMKVAEYGEIHVDRHQYSIFHDHPLAPEAVVVEERALFDVVSKDQARASSYAVWATAAPSSPAAATTGRSTAKVEPLPSSELTERRPSIRRTSSRQM